MTTLTDPPPPNPPPPAAPVLDPFSFESRNGRDDKTVVTWLEVVLVLGAAALGNVVMGSTLSSLAGTLGLALVAVALLAGRRMERRESAVLVGVALFLTPWFVVRASPNLTAVTVIAIVGLLSLAAGLSKRGSLFDLRLGHVIGHVSGAWIDWLFGLRMVQRLVQPNISKHPVVPLARGLALALPVVLALGALLASADAVFAHALSFDKSLTPGLTNLFWIAVIAAGGFGLVSRAANESPGVEGPEGRMLGRLETVVIVGSVAILFAVFVALQALVALGGADHVIETEGLTAAEYARQGFFQLLWVAGLTLCLVSAIRFAHEGDGGEPSWPFRRLAAAVLSLTLAITAVAVQRLWLYTDAFGLTTRRFWALAAALGIGVVLLTYLVNLSGWRREHRWMPGAVVMIGVVFVLALNVINPDQAIAAYNLAKPPAERPLDLRMLTKLSPDATVTVLDAADDLDPQRFNELVALVCRPGAVKDKSSGLSFNLARMRAEDVISGFCSRD